MSYHSECADRMIVNARIECPLHRVSSQKGSDLLKDVFSTFLILKKKKFFIFLALNSQEKIIIFLHDNCIFHVPNLLPVTKFHFLWFSCFRLQKAHLLL